MAHPAARPAHHRGRHPPGRPCRPRHRPARPPAGHRPDPDHPRRLRSAAGLGPRARPAVAWGVEGTGCYGAGLARFLAAHGQVVVEVNRPDRPPGAARASPTPSTPRPPPGPCRPARPGGAQGRQRPGGDDPLAAGGPRAPPCGPAPRPSTPSRRCWSPPPLSSASSSAACRRAGWSPPPPAAPEPGPITSPMAAAKLALRTLARRHQALPPRSTDLDSPSWTGWSPGGARAGGAVRGRPRRAGALLVAAGDNPEPAAQRGRVLDAVRRLTDPGLLRQDHPASPQPGRRPPGQRRAVPDRGRAAALAPAHPRLHGHDAPAEGKTKKEIIRCFIGRVSVL